MKRALFETTTEKPTKNPFQEVKNWFLYGNNCTPPSREGKFGICPLPSWNSLALKELLGKMWSCFVRSAHSEEELCIFFPLEVQTEWFWEGMKQPKKQIPFWQGDCWGCRARTGQEIGFLISHIHLCHHSSISEPFLMCKISPELDFDPIIRRFIHFIVV